MSFLHFVEWKSGSSYTSIAGSQTQVSVVADKNSRYCDSNEKWLGILDNISYAMIQIVSKQYVIKDFKKIIDDLGC